MDTGIRPNFEHWRQHDAIAIWQVAALMQGVDPRAWKAGEVVGRDGDVLDLSEEQDQLLSAVHAQSIECGQFVHPPITSTSMVKMPSVIEWLRTHDNTKLADNLDRSRHVPQPDQIFKKKTLVDRNIGVWPTIEEDIKRAKDNGLDEAQPHKHGMWNETTALDWARQNGRLKNKSAPVALPINIWPGPTGDVDHQ